MAACAGSCHQGRTPCKTAQRCGLVTASPHGRTVDTEIHEAPTCPPDSTIEVNSMLSFLRLFCHLRRSGMTVRNAIARAWAGRK